MKKIFIGLIAILCLLTTNTAFAYEGQSIGSAEASENYIIDRYDALYDKYDGNLEKTLNELVSSSDSLEIIDCSERICTATGEIATKSDPGDVRFTDTIVHDSDWGTYVYIGTWDWITRPNEAFLSPWDVLEVYSQSIEYIQPKEYIVYGYNSSGNRVAYYNTDTQSYSGDVQKGVESSNGAAFWVNEASIDNGRITVPLIYKKGSPTTKIMMEYNHSYSKTAVDSLSGNIGKDGFGFGVSWNTGTSGWGPITSVGARIPQ